MKKSKKPIPEAPRAKLTLRDIDAPDWRWRIPKGTKIYMRRRLTVGMPEEMREATEIEAARLKLPMSEVWRRRYGQGSIARKGGS